MTSIIITSFYCNCYAQGDVRITTGIGLSKYLGDLTEAKDRFSTKDAHPILSVGATYDFSAKLRARLNISILSVSGDDKDASRADFVSRNLNFKSSIWEIAPMVEYDLLNRDNYALIPYVFTGFSVYHFNPTTIDSLGNKVYLHDVGTEGQYLPQAVKDTLPFAVPKMYKRTQINIPFGIGLRYEVSETFTIGLELTSRFLFTDYLDDVSSRNYINPAIFTANGQTKAAELGYRVLGSDYNIFRPRGDPSHKDFYYSVQLSFAFKLQDFSLFGSNPYSGYRRSRF